MGKPIWVGPMARQDSMELEPSPDASSLEQKLMVLVCGRDLGLIRSRILSGSGRAV